MQVQYVCEQHGVMATTHLDRTGVPFHEPTPRAQRTEPSGSELQHVPRIDERRASVRPPDEKRLAVRTGAGPKIEQRPGSKAINELARYSSTRFCKMLMK